MDLQEELCLPSGFSRRLSDVDDMTKVKLTRIDANSTAGPDQSSSQFTMSTIDRFTKRKSLKTMGTGTSLELNSLDPSSFEPECKFVSKILVLYTGGTIGMRAEKGIYKPQPNYFVKAIRRLPMFHDQSTNHLPAFSSVPLESMPLIMPLSPDLHRVVYYVSEYDPIIDSSDMTMDDWVTIGRDIDAEYQNFDGFVVLSGTDTLSYTASALSFILENLGKPVVVTGSQIPIFETRSDGRDNFLGALIVAGHCSIPEVTVYFHNRLLRGSRVTKVSTHHFDAFESPNHSPLVEFGVGMTVHKDRIFRPYSIEPFTLFPNLNPNVSILRFFPSISIDIVRQQLAEPMDGVVLQSFGAGNIPSGRLDLIELLKNASDRGCLLINISQCPLGPVKPLYEGGARLRDIGVLCGGDMTPEAALTKLCYVLGKSDWSHEKKREAMERSLRGEVTAERRIEEMRLQEKDDKVLQGLQQSLQLTTLKEARDLRESLMPFLMCTAATQNNAAELRNLMNMCTSLQISDYDKRTPLHLAACEGHLEAVDILLQHGALVHVKDRFGTTPLISAIQSRHPKVIQKIRKAGGHLTMSSGNLGTELYNAASNNDIELLRMYSLAGADISTKNNEGRNILHAAAFFGFDDIYHFVTETLESIDYEEMVKTQDGMSQRPVDIAKERRNEELVELLQR